MRRGGGPLALSRRALAMRVMKRALRVVVVLVAAAIGFITLLPSPATPANSPQAALAAAPEMQVASATALGAERAAPAVADAMPPAASPDETPRDETAPRAPLPPLDQPFAQHLDELRRRAREGDARAACRLGMELALCSGIDDFRRLRGVTLAAKPESPTPEQAEGEKFFADSYAWLERQCGGVVAADPLEAFHAQVAAARGGVVQSQLQLAAFPPLRGVDFIDRADVWREWRSAALPGLEAALAAGDPRAPYALARAYDHDQFVFTTPRLAPPDPFRAYVYYRLVTLIEQRSGRSDLDSAAAQEEAAASTLDEVQRAAAAHEAERLLATNFAGFGPGSKIGSTDGDDLAACGK